MKQTLNIMNAIILAVLLAACGVATPAPIIPPTGTFTPSPIPPSSTPTLPPATLTLTPPFPLPVSSAPDGLRIAYIGNDSNLYVQSGSKAPAQLTHIDKGSNSYPHFSDDGERLVFVYNPELDSPLATFHSIHTDGTDEKVLLPTGLLQSLGLGYTEFTDVNSVAFVPGTHQLVFNTRQINEQMATLWPYHDNIKRNLDLLSIDVDTGDLKSLLPPGKGGNFLISPDGKMIAVQATGHIDLIGIDGHVIHPNLVTYATTTPHELIPDMFWARDSTELLVTLPIDPVYQYTRAECTQDVAARGIWRYAIDGDSGTQTLLTPPPIGESGQGRYDVYFRVSPDGNWISYNYYHEFGCQTDETVKVGLYLGDLHQGTTQFYASEAKPVWSPDSTHFVYEVWDQGLFLGSVDEPPILLDVPRDYLLGWADPTHYLAYYSTDETVMGMLGEIGGETIYFPVSVPVSSFEDDSRYYKFDFISLNHQAYNFLQRFYNPVILA